MTASAPQRWLSLVGIGEDGLDGLTPAARRLLSQAELVVGGERHLGLAGSFPGERMAWPSPLTDGIPAILARRGRPVCVLATGDPFFFGVGATLMRHVDPAEMLCLPAPSAFSLAAARLGWALQDCAPVSLHGRSFERIVPLLQPGARILALSWDETTPGRLAALLRERGLGGSRLVVCEALGGPRERILDATADSFDAEVDPLNTVGLEVVAAPGARVLPLASGIPDSLFEHDGQITKREVRAITLSALAPRQGELLWDVGAGSGSVGIEWMLRHPANRAIAVEPRPDRAARIARNAAALGTPDLRIVQGAAPAALAGLPAPDAVFVGGGGTDPAVIDAAWSALSAGGRLVVNAVTLETQADLIARQARWGGELVSIQLARADAVGGFRGWRPAMPVAQWSVEKPEGAQ
ncbi:precorrin-6y C5,15-methyltransferase (decarboxylating) subunit CbiE [Alsobacter sp. SYSU M60028]|uniref:Precorrin-6y C5,15-methyltransferase (Decarboxylating) subunit CbiE n=1 Tax=Alsobacter ponti TaxID=2962936 RepID=A0ABT1LE99_9HYPH|nr:precorrin-6y C5,15-methyltransferase (decarboxylating) subunit CbiE [Alsobacter ponti]MCP8939827.1 precorrin-6y C5,15-methyltransferase (decarboxylating) subunit CbiE [Alsobacter ponti]